MSHLRTAYCIYSQIINPQKAGNALDKSSGIVSMGSVNCFKCTFADPFLKNISPTLHLRSRIMPKNKLRRTKIEFPLLHSVIFLMHSNSLTTLRSVRYANAIQSNSTIVLRIKRGDVLPTVGLKGVQSSRFSADNTYLLRIKVENCSEFTI